MIVPVRGIRFYKFKKPALKEQVIIVREPFNRFDDHALAVYNSLTGEKMGYVGREFNHRIYECMKGDLLYGAVFMSGKHQILVELKLPAKKTSPEKLRAKK